MDTPATDENVLQKELFVCSLSLKSQLRECRVCVALVRKHTRFCICQKHSHRLHVKVELVKKGVDATIGVSIAQSCQRSSTAGSRYSSFSFHLVK